MSYWIGVTGKSERILCKHCLRHIMTEIGTEIPYAFEQDEYSSLHPYHVKPGPGNAVMAQETKHRVRIKMQAECIEVSLDGSVHKIDLDEHGLPVFSESLNR